MSLKTLVASAFFALALPVAHAADATPAAPAKQVATATARVNVNTADVMALTTLKGVGEKKARDILAYRKEHGPFNSLEQFEQVPGIGPAIIAKNKHLIVFR